MEQPKKRVYRGERWYPESPGCAPDIIFLIIVVLCLGMAIWKEYH